MPAPRHPPAAARRTSPNDPGSNLVKSGSDTRQQKHTKNFKVSRIDRIMISSTGASADSVFLLDLRFSNFDQLNHAARRTRERSLRGMLNLAIFAIQVRSTNCNTTIVTHTHTPHAQVTTTGHTEPSRFFETSFRFLCQRIFGACGNADA